MTTSRKSSSPEDRSSILVVDDDPGMLDYLADLLRLEGYRVTATPDATGALEAVDSRSFDCIVLDLLMPTSNGLQLLKVLRDRNIGTGVIILSAIMTAKTARLASSLGVSHYVTKPATSDVLLRAIEAVLKEARKSSSSKPAAPPARPAPPPAPRAESLMHAGAPVHSRGMKEVLQHARDASRSFLGILIDGAPGTGKTELTWYIRQRSGFDSESVSFLDCGALPPQVIERVLFGRTRAQQGGIVGLLENDRPGLVVLDRAERIPAEMHSLFTRFLGVREGAGVSLITMRSIATEPALDRDALMRAFCGRPGCHRLRLPGLAERPEDILPIARAVLATAPSPVPPAARGLAPAVEGALVRYSWPGNVSELQTVVQDSLRGARSEILQMEDLPPRFFNVATGAPRG